MGNKSSLLEAKLLRSCILKECTRAGGAGGLIFISPSIKHSYHNPSRRPSFLPSISPSAFAESWREFSAAISQRRGNRLEISLQFSLLYLLFFGTRKERQNFFLTRATHLAAVPRRSARATLLPPGKYQHKYNIISRTWEKWSLFTSCCSQTNGRNANVHKTA